MPSEPRDAAIDMHIRVDDLTSSAISALLNEHLESMGVVSPPESRHALDLTGLRQPDITFWSLWHDGELAGCAALKQLGLDHGEVKSMRTARTHLRKGVARKLLQHVIAEAKRRNYRRVSLETGSMAYFEPARALYRSAGFEDCPPFGNYVLDPNSVFMSMEL